MRKNMIFIDTETSGLVAGRHVILQLAWIIEIDGKIAIERCFDVQPDLDDDMTLGALKVNCFTLERMLCAFRRTAVLEKLYGDLMTYASMNPIIPCGHNVRFDLDMLYALAKKGNETWWINYGLKAPLRICRPVCTLALCHYLDYKGHLNLSDYKLATVCKEFNIELSDAHDALADVRATRHVFHKLDEFIEEETDGERITFKP